MTRPEDIAEQAVDAVLATTVPDGEQPPYATGWALIISTVRPSADPEASGPRTNLLMLTPDDADPDRLLGLLRRATVATEREVT